MKLQIMILLPYYPSAGSKAQLQIGVLANELPFQRQFHGNAVACVMNRSRCITAGILPGLCVATASLYCMDTTIPKELCFEGVVFRAVLFLVSTALIVESANGILIQKVSY
ncbi:unnamed protein product [Ostreobium quekettii]|uniref:Uncharacterized protein n=1 Tax=Ostreobium quekettii TaxID=121088 RepID=A0A8S1IVB1_9CHLO|nr:unnamed protein product [Ostreobium quekettii]